jgi:hypothetical protein
MANRGAAVSDDPRDWYKLTTANGEPAYLITREGAVFYVMKADGKVPAQAQVEIANIVAAWYRGEIFSRSAAPTLEMLLSFDKHAPEPRAKLSIEIADGVSGLQKLWIRMAEENRGLDHAALKALFEQHQIVMAVWRAEDLCGGPGFLTLKGIDHLLAQVERGAKKIRATMMAIPCNNKEHAELLRQAFGGDQSGGCTGS